MSNEYVEVYVTDLGENFAACFTAMADEVHANSRDKGWWDEDRNNGEMIALMHSELSEALDVKIEYRDSFDAQWRQEAIYYIFRQ